MKLDSTKFKGELGARLRVARERKGLTKTALAIQLGCSVGEFSRWENGRRLPRVDWLVLAAAFLETPIGELVPGVEFTEEAVRGS